MATELEIRVTAELREIKAALASLQRDVAKVGSSANASAASGRALTGSLQTSSIAARKAAVAAEGMRGAIAGAVTQVQLLVGGLGAAALGATLVRMADSATRLRGQLGLVTKSQAELSTAMAQTFAIAQRTRQGLEATVNLYARIARTAKGTQAQTLALTESISQAVALSFTTADAAQAALFQLGQGLGSGTLRGEELNSVLEQTPRLAQAIAEGLVKLGKIKDPGGLRAYAKENGIAAELVVQALATQQKTLREEFAKLPPTISDAFTQLKNSAIKYIGEIDRAEGASRRFAEAIGTIAQNLDKIGATLVLGAQLAAGYYLAFRILPAVVAALGAAVLFLNRQLALNTPLMARFAAQALTVKSSITGAAIATNTFSLSMTGAAIAAGSMKTKILAAFSVLGAAIAGYKIGEYLAENFLFAQIAGIKMARTVHVAIIEISSAFKRATTEMREAWAKTMNYLGGAQADTMDSLAVGFDKMGGSLGEAMAKRARAAAAEIRGNMTGANEAIAAAEAMRRENLAAIAKVNEGYDALEDAAYAAQYRKDAALETPGGDGTTPPLADAVKKVAESFELLKDAAERSLRELERNFELGLISTKAYYAEKQRLQEASIDADIAGARSELAVASNAEERKKAIIQITLLERARRDIAVQAANDQADAEKDLAQQLEEVATKLLALDGRTAEARQRELEAQYRDLLRRLEADSDTAGQAIVKKLINVEAAKAELDQLKDQFSGVTTALGQLEATTAAQVSAGLLSNATAEDRLSEARAKAIEQLNTQRAAVAALYEQYRDPATLLHLQQLDQQIAQLSIGTEDWRGKIQDAGTDALTTFFKDLASGAVTAEDAVRNLAVNFSQALAAMAAQALAKKAIQGIFDAFSGDKEGAAGGATEVATAAAAGLAYAAPVTGAATALGVAGATLVSGAAAVTASAVALQAAATALLVANSASIAHSGGVVGTIAGSLRKVPLGTFAGAPRLHSGGVAGVRSTEVATILQRGEEVITRTDPRHRYNGGKSGEAAGSGPGMVRTPVVAIGDRAIADAMASAAGTQVILTAVKRHWGGLTSGSGQGNGN